MPDILLSFPIQADLSSVFRAMTTPAGLDLWWTRVGFTLGETSSGVLVEFCHRGWREANAHVRGSGYCRASYLRILKRHLEHDERVPYEARDSA